MSRDSPVVTKAQTRQGAGAEIYGREAECADKCDAGPEGANRGRDRGDEDTEQGAARRTKCG